MKNRKFIKQNQQEVEEKMFPNKKWLKDHGFKILKKCKDIVDWASNEAEREYLDNTYRKVLSCGVNIHVTDEDGCWKANLFSDSYDVSRFGKNTKDAVEKVFEIFKKEMQKLNKALESI